MPSKKLHHTAAGRQTLLEAVPHLCFSQRRLAQDQEPIRVAGTEGRRCIPAGISR
jgi:hypothetical protein